MPEVPERLFALQQTFLRFFEEGGVVLLALMALGLMLVLLLTERALYLGLVYRRNRQRIHRKLSGLKHPYRKLSLIGDAELDLQAHFPLIKCLIGLCPLLGLLGTVSGMIDLFDTLAVQSSGNIKLMAAGVAKTVYPTLTGMSLALITLLLLHPLEQYRQKELQHFMSLKLENFNAKGTYR